MCWWTWISLECPRLFREGLVVLASQKIELFYALVFECELVKNKKNQSLLTEMQTDLFELVPKNWVNDLRSSMAFAKKLRKLAVRFQTASYGGMPPVRLPWSPSELFCGLDVIKQYNSSCKPIVIRITLTNGEKIQCLLKNEDVRTDRLAMTIGYFINNLSFTPIVQTYTVFPFGASLGCITMIPDVQTLYTINENTTVLNYILSNNENENIRTVRGRFINSCAGACLLAFILGLRDRHLQNILVQKNGVLSNVDFGYILGKDPKYLNTKMRITTGMVEAIGGTNSTGYKEFVHLIRESYSKIRLHSSLFFHLLSAESFIFKDKRRPITLIKKHCQAVFFPGLFNKDAELLIENIVDDCCNETLYTKLCDQIHRLGQHF
jgi:phosphatidylinositol 3-kinase|tara:strand:- start:1295 stop:2431 length:1137 start_codon:yes stop_codon:yes gene_type:complete